MADFRNGESASNCQWLGIDRGQRGGGFSYGDSRDPYEDRTAECCGG